MKHYDTIQLTSYHTGDLPDELMEEISTHLNVCQECKLVVEKLQEEKENFLNEFPFESLSFDEPAETKIAAFPNRAMRVISSIAALLVITVSVQFMNNEDSLGTVSFKGENNFTILSSNTEGEITERDEQSYFPGERIQICYTAMDSLYLSLLSIDEKGSVSRYFPVEGDVSTVISPGVKVPLTHSIRLDSYIGKEFYIQVLSEKPYVIDELITEIEEAFLKGSILEFTASQKGFTTVKEIVKRERNEK